jgi:RNA polymerase sigma-54 factor
MKMNLTRMKILKNADESTESEREFDINDYLDDDLPQYKTSVNNTSRDDEDRSMPISGGVSFQEVLLVTTRT